MGIALKTTVERILKSPSIPLVICTDSRSLYGCLVKLGTTIEKRLMVDIMCLRQSYEKREIAEVRWINGNTKIDASIVDAYPGLTPNSSSGYTSPTKASTSTHQVKIG
jgi:hypothetical protein